MLCGSRPSVHPWFCLSEWRVFGEQTSQILEFKPEGLDFLSINKTYPCLVWWWSHFLQWKLNFSVCSPPFPTFDLENNQIVLYSGKKLFSNFSCMFLNTNNFSNMNSNCSNLLDMRNLQEQVKKAFCYQKLFWPFTVWVNCDGDLKDFANSWPSGSNFFLITKAILF